MAFTPAQRVALWRAWGKRCFYSGQPIPFQDLEVDHVIPASLAKHPEQLSALLKRLSLPPDFDLNSFHNLVPALHSENRRKSGRSLPDAGLVLCLDRVKSQYEHVVREFERYHADDRAEDILVSVLQLIEKRVITTDHIIDFLHANARLVDRPDFDPLVIAVGFTVPSDALFYSPFCDAVESRLMDGLRQLSGFVTQLESERNGETLSVRFAAWHLSLDSVLPAIHEPWEVLEVARFSDLYPGSDPEQFYQQAIVHRRLARP